MQNIVTAWSKPCQKSYISGNERKNLCSCGSIQILFSHKLANNLLMTFKVSELYTILEAVEQDFSHDACDSKAPDMSEASSTTHL